MVRIAQTINSITWKTCLKPPDPYKLKGKNQVLEDSCNWNLNMLLSVYKRTKLIKMVGDKSTYECDISLKNYNKLDMS